MGKNIKEIDGLPVINAKKMMKILITAADVKQARRKKPETCAIAKTCLRQPRVKEVRIHLSRAYVRDNKSNWKRFMVPRALRSEIIAFDRGGKFSPGEYVLYKPLPAYIASGGRTPKTGKGKKPRRKMHFVQDVRPSA